MSEDVVLQRGKGMLHRRSSQSHHFRGRSLLHALERVFVQMTRDETLPAVRTAHLQGTGTADFRFRCIVHSTIFAGELFRSEEHTSELQSRGQLVCRLLLEKKNQEHEIDR